MNEIYTSLRYEPPKTKWRAPRKRKKQVTPENCTGERPYAPDVIRKLALHTRKTSGARTGAMMCIACLRKESGKDAAADNGLTSVVGEERP